MILDPVKKVLDTALLNNDYGVLSSIIWEFDQPVNFAATGYFAITKDLICKIEDLNPLIISIN